MVHFRWHRLQAMKTKMNQRSAMKNMIASVIALVLGFFTVTFAAVMGLFIGLGALIAKPFIKRKLNAAYKEAMQQQGFNTYNTEGGASHQGTTIDGEYEDISQRPHQSTHHRLA